MANRGRCIYPHMALSMVPQPQRKKTDTPQGHCSLRHVSELLDERGNWSMLLVNRHVMPMDVAEIMKIKVSSWLGIHIIAWAQNAMDLYGSERLSPCL